MVHSCENDAVCIQFLNEFGNQLVQKFVPTVVLPARLLYIIKRGTTFIFMGKSLNKLKTHRRCDRILFRCYAMQDMVLVMYDDEHDTERKNKHDSQATEATAAARGAVHEQAEHGGEGAARADQQGGQIPVRSRALLCALVLSQHLPFENVTTMMQDMKNEQVTWTIVDVCVKVIRHFDLDSDEDE